MHPLLLITALFCSGCADRDPLGAGALDPAATVESAYTFDGCARFTVAVSARDEVTVTTDAALDCGPVVPVIGPGAAFDRTRGRVRLPVVLENRGGVKVKGPAWLAGWSDSLRVEAPPGLVENRHTRGYLAFAGADSAIGRGAAEWAGASLWAFDRHLAPSESAQALAPGSRSLPRWVELDVHPGVHRFTLSFHARARRARTPVPYPIPEDSQGPFWPAHPELHVSCTGTSMRLLCVRDVVRVLFHGWATHEQIQAAIDSVDGDFVSGFRMTGAYNIRVPGYDGTIGPVRRAISRLRSLPQVEMASAIVIDSIAPDYLKPYDGPDWRRWELARHQGGHNWGWEAISAPFAWGCETGSPDAAVAVVDYGFHRPAELWANVDSARSYNVGVLSAPGDPEHGTGVAAVLAARGNDSTGITGGLWRARLRLYEVAGIDGAGAVVRTPRGGVRLTHDTVMARLKRATHEGASVVNISLGSPWGPVGYDPGADPDTAIRREIEETLAFHHRELRRWVDSLSHAGAAVPLIVLSAGNTGIDAKWNVLRAASDSVPNVLVVAAAEPAADGRVAAWSETLGGASGATNHGASVDVAAPGGGIYTLDRHGREDRASGTSVAAPFVAALAGLLVSFDPRLAREPARLKALIVEGARRSGKRIANGAGPDSIPLIDAYESLKLAAMRRGAPVCGNAVWAAGDTVFIQRDTVSGAVPEKIVVGQFVDRLDVLHGGRRIRMRLPVRPQIGFRWDAGAWVSDPTLTQARFADAVPGSGGAFLGWGDYYLGKLARSHDGDTAVSMVRGSGRSWDFTLSAYGTSRRLASVPDDATGLNGRVCILRPVSAQADTAQKPCYIETLGPGAYRGTGWSYAYVQNGTPAAPSGRLLVVKTETGYTRAFGPWSSACPAMPREWWIDRPDTAVDPGSVPTECRSFTTSARTVGTHYALFDLAGRVVDQWLDSTGESTLWGVGEDGRSEMVTRWVYATDATFGIVPFGHIATLAQTEWSDNSTCHLEERLLAREGRIRWTRAGCPNASTPTFGASRSPERAAALLPKLERGLAFADARRSRR